MHDDGVLPKAIAWVKQGRRVALAVVVSTWGSSPRPVGSMMAINEKGEFVGSVSGGCVESFVVSEAVDVIEDGGYQDLVYGVTNEQAEAVRLTCGGDIRVFVANAPSLTELERMAGTQPVTRVIDLASGETLLIQDGAVEGTLQLKEDLVEELHCLHKQGGGDVLLQDDTSELFVSTHTRPRNMVIVGAVHITQVLAPMAISVGFDVTVIDSRPAFATRERLPGITVVRERTEKAMQKIKIDRSTAIVLLAHDPILDDPALHAALNSDAYYIGCLGSRRTHAKRLERLNEAGFGDDAVRRLHAPIGLDLGGRASGEIAVAILAQIIAVENKRSLPA